MSLLRELDRVRARLRWCVLLRGGLLWCGCLLTGFLLVGIADWFWQPEKHGIRWGLLGGLLVWILLSGWSCLVRIWLTPLSVTDVALQLERSDGRWRGQLAAAAAAQQEPHLPPASDGNLVDSVAWRLHWWPLIPSIVPLVACLGFLAMMWSLQPQLVQIGLARTLLPAEPIRWPRHTELQMMLASGGVLSPGRALRVDARHPLTLYITDREGTPPSEVELQLKFASGHIESHTLRPETGTLPRGALGEFEFSWLPAAGTTWVRVRGGDDETVAWCAVEAVSAPAIRQTQVTLTFPEYLQLPVRELSTLPAKLSLPVGTRLQVSGELDRPIQHLLYRTARGESISLPLDGDGTSFRWEETLQAGSQRVFWFEAIDDSGLSAARPPRHELIPVSDALPEVRVRIPERDLFITPQARIPWELQLRDDDRIEKVELHLSSGSENSHVVWSQTWPGSEEAPPTIGGWLDLGSAPPAIEVSRKQDAETIELPLSSPAPGTELRISARARDSHPGEDRWTTSPPRILRIVPSAEKLKELEQQVTVLANQLSEQGDILARQQRMLRELRREIEQRESIAPGDVQPLQAFHQWLGAAADIVGSGAGVRHQMRQIIREAEANRLPPADLVHPLSSIEQQLSRLQERELANCILAVSQLAPSFEQLRRTNSSVNWSPPALHELVRAELAGESLRQAWDEVLLQLTRWTQQVDFRDRFDALYAASQSARESTFSLAQRTLARSTATLSPEERAQLDQLVQQYQQLAIEAESLQRPLSLDQRSAPQIVSAHQRWTSADAASQFHRISESLRRNSMGQALQAEVEIQKLLDAIRSLLHDSIPAQDELLFEKVVEQRQLVETLLSRQQQLLLALSAATFSEDSQSREELDRLAKHSEELLHSAQQLRRRLQSMHLDAPTRPLDAVSDHLQATRIHLSARQRAAAQSQLKRARDRTTQVVDALRKLEQQLAEETVRQHLARFSRSCAELAARQARLTTETVRLRQLQESEQRWTRGQLQTLLETSTLQSKLADELVELRLQVPDLSLVQIVTDEAVRNMQTCAGLLRERDVSTETERRQREVEAMLMSLAEHLHSPTTGPTQPATTPDGDPAASPIATALPPEKAAELRLLAALQADLNRRTRLAAETMPPTTPSDELKQSLLEEQRKLATWLKALLQEHPDRSPATSR